MPWEIKLVEIFQLSQISEAEAKFEEKKWDIKRKLYLT